MSYQTRSSLSFSSRELIDLAIAWVTLSVAFAILLSGGSAIGGIDPAALVRMTLLSLVTVGVGFLSHELAHKVVAIRFGQVAEFKADYGMLFVALMSALVGFLFAAPGAVHHRGRITLRENGLIALAGPLTNQALAAVFFALYMAPATLGGPPLVGEIGRLGVWINLFLAAFNMLPWGPLDGTTVKRWNTSVFVLVFVPSLLAALYVMFVGV
ncbi:metalloprotease [Halovivax cerinus]|uniref:Metalloprotease n=1 Tax=Halovivax cerinus TaxID=1487865 RepID=A0ABD5NMU6_9EURY|nr:metalloprotease [Halovivax cerinus]